MSINKITRDRIPIEKLKERLDKFKDYKEPVLLYNEVLITDPQKFIKIHLSYLNKFPEGKSKKRFLPYYDRLLDFCLLLEKKL